MGNFFGFFDDEHEEKEAVDKGKLRLRKEELDITKDRVRTGEVEISKEIVEEERAVNVPVAHDEVIVERRALNERTDEEIADEETIHIPVTKEQVHVDKHTVITGEIAAYKEEVAEDNEIRETLKREEARVHTDGEAKVISDRDSE